MKTFEFNFILTSGQHNQADKMKERKPKFQNLKIKDQNLLILRAKTKQTKKLLQRLDEDKFKLKSIKLTQINEDIIREALNCIQEHKAQILYGENCDRHLLIHIGNISFPNLTQVYLESSNIESMEAMCRISMPKLRILRIEENYIVSLKPLRKANFRALEWLAICNNQLREFPSFSEANFPQMEYLFIQFNSSVNSYLEDINFLFKCRKIRLKYIYIARKSRIAQKSFLGKFAESKHARISFLSHLKKNPSI